MYVYMFSTTVMILISIYATSVAFMFMLQLMCKRHDFATYALRDDWFTYLFMIIAQLIVAALWLPIAIIKHVMERIMEAGMSDNDYRLKYQALKSLPTVPPLSTDGASGATHTVKEPDPATTVQNFIQRSAQRFSMEQRMADRDF